MSSKEWAETWFHTFPGAAGLNTMPSISLDISYVTAARVAYQL